MTKLPLKRALRRDQRKTIASVAELLGGPIAIRDTDGNVVFGEEDAAGEAYPVVSAAGDELGTITGPDGAQKLTSLIGHLWEREVEKRGLAAETLERYKELSLLYDLSDTLSRVLEVDEVAQLVVDEARRFLRATSATLLLFDRRREELRPVASVGTAQRSEHDDHAIEREVLESGRAEFETSDDAAGGSTMCAPLRSGDDVIGLLRVASDEPTQWTSGDLKFVTSLASNAAPAITHAMLHRDQLQEQALRGQVERFVSPELPEAAANRGAEAAVLFCDLGALARSAEREVNPEQALRRLHRTASRSLALLLERGATVDIPRGEMLVALFADQDFSVAARTALDAAKGLFRLLHAVGDGEFSPGIAVSRSAIGSDDWLAGVGAAATLQAAAGGRIVADETIVTHADSETHHRPLTGSEWQTDSTVYEVET